jgi:hypothetical protein
LTNRRSSWIWRILNKIWIYRELDKEQISPLDLSKIRDRIWIKNHGSSRDWNSIGFDWNFWELINLRKELVIALER